MIEGYTVVVVGEAFRLSKLQYPAVVMRGVRVGREEGEINYYACNYAHN